MHCFHLLPLFLSGNRTPGDWWTDSCLTQEVSDNIGNIGWWWNNLEHYCTTYSIYTQRGVNQGPWKFCCADGYSCKIYDLSISIYMYLQPTSTNPGMEPTQAWKPIKPPVFRFLHLPPARALTPIGSRSHCKSLTSFYKTLTFVDGTDFQGFDCWQHTHFALFWSCYHGLGHVVWTACALRKELSNKHCILIKAETIQKLPVNTYDLPVTWAF